MYVIIGSHFAPLEGKYLLIELVIVRITLNVIVPSNAPKGMLNNTVSIVQKTCCQTLKHFDNVFATGGKNIVEVFESVAVALFEVQMRSTSNIYILWFQISLIFLKHTCIFSYDSGQC
jgi:hypothetical protein